LTKILERARQGDKSVLPVVRKMLELPERVGALGGNLAWQAEHSLLRAATGDDLAAREAMARKLELLRAELGGPAPSPLERLLVERVAACWFQLHYAEALITQQAENFSLVQAEYHDRRRDRAHKRYLAAIKALALVRKLVVPVLQVNIARKQVNVAGALPNTAPPADPRPGSHE
jgi:hypothetical protein